VWSTLARNQAIEQYDFKHMDWNPEYGWWLQEMPEGIEKARIYFANNVRTNTTYSRFQITLWNQQGSEVIQGTLLVIPIEEALLYIRPLYLRASGGRIPELKRVIVAYQNQIVMDETLDKALGQIFGSAPASPSEALAAPILAANAELSATEMLAAAVPLPDASSPTLARQAQEHYSRALQAQRQGNWSTYGAEIERLGSILERLEDLESQN